MNAEQHGARTFGRLIWFDERSWAYPVRSLAKERARSVLWRCPSWLDQGREGACVAFAWSHELASDPVPVQGVDETFARQLYYAAQRRDPWPGGAYPGAMPHYEGTTVLAAAKELRRRGIVENYYWAFGAEDLVHGLQVGPAVLGLQWHEGMQRPDSVGIVKPTGKVLGGHAILCRGFDMEGEFFILRNSWGADWGLNGDCVIFYDDMAKLLQEQGEACFPIGRRLTPQPMGFWQRLREWWQGVDAAIRASAPAWGFAGTAVKPADEHYCQMCGGDCLGTCVGG